MVDIMAVRQAYYQFEISALLLIAGQENPSDGLSKIIGNGVL